MNRKQQKATESNPNEYGILTKELRSQPEGILLVKNECQ